MTNILQQIEVHLHNDTGCKSAIEIIHSSRGGLFEFLILI